MKSKKILSFTLIILGLVILGLIIMTQFGLLNKWIPKNATVINLSPTLQKDPLQNGDLLFDFRAEEPQNIFETVSAEKESELFKKHLSSRMP
ncbi:MAG: hypothetical protein HQM15_05870 [Deltaproteobacteria bacterium]|nr:hypothetical protein [Deltaproteobacteria bacterium]